MSVTDYKTDWETQQLGMEILHKGLSVSDFIRFMQHKIKALIKPSINPFQPVQISALWERL